MERQFKDSDKAVERHGKRGGKAGEKERNDSGKRQRLFTAFPQTSAATLLKTETPFRAFPAVFLPNEWRLPPHSCPTNGAFPRTPAAIRCDRPWTGRENAAEVLKKGKGKAVEGQQNIGGQAVETQ